MKMENKIIENHKIETVEHDMHVDGQILKEKKVTTFIEGRHSGMEGNWDAIEIVKYVRSIENDKNRCLEVTEHFREGFITGRKDRKSEIENGDPRKMTEDEIEQFENDWDKLSCLAFLNTRPNLTHSTQID